MYLIEVVPLIRGTMLSSLSYYSKMSYAIGDIVEVPIRKRLVRAVIIEITPLGTAKTALRAATFSLKKLPSQKRQHRISSILTATAQALARIYPASIGSILFSLLSPEVRDGEVEMLLYKKEFEREKREEVTMIQQTQADRYSQYISKIREAFAHRGSVLFVVPTTADIDFAEEALQHGIEGRVVIFSPRRGKKRMEKSYEAHADLTKSKVIITTPTHAYSERHDITTIIIDSCHSSHYKSKRRPYIDHRDALLIFARESGCEVIMGDILPRSEEEFMRREGIYLPFDNHPKRLALKGRLTHIDISQFDEHSEGRFTILAPKLIKKIEDTIAKKENVFLYASRRGIAPMVVCYDCGHVFKCPDSGAPYSLFRTYRDGVEKRWFLSGATGKRVPAADVCVSCGSWRLKEQGVGIQHIQDVCKKLFPDTPLVLFDHTTATTHKRATALVEEFYGHKGAILLGTHMVLRYLHNPVSMSVVVSLDATRMTPAWRAEEGLFSLLLTLRDISTENVCVQSRTPEEAVVTHAKTGAVEQFYNEEIVLREKLHYPPFVTFILISFYGTSKEVIDKYEALLATLVSPFEIEFYSSLVSEKEKRMRHGLVRVPREQWPHQGLVEGLRKLPPDIRIEINPEKII